MADEITITAGMSCLNGQLVVSEPTKTIQVDMAGTHQVVSVQDIGHAAHEAIVVPAELATLGYSLVKNLDSTNYVQIGRDVGATFYPVLKLFPGEFALVRFANVALYAQANTATVKLRYSILEN